jgi:AhpD family alkylhydroperoxidase
MKRLLFLSLLFMTWTLSIKVPAALADDVRASYSGNIAAENNSVIQSTYKDIKNTLGLVPTFMKEFPPASLPGAWSEFKSIQLSPNTAIPNKYKELIGLAVASQVPCHYCTFFHTTAAKMFGAQDKEVQEAVAISAMERQWSTIINGMQTDQQAFREDTDTFLKRVQEAKAAQKSVFSENPTVTAASSPEAVYREIEETMGTVPDFLRKFPASGVAGAWDHLKTLTFSGNTSLPPKYKDLISLAVSSQIPCSYCIYFDTAAAKVDGATDAEIQEAVAMSSLSRHWSTVLNGLQTNEGQFRSEMNRSFAYIQQQQKKAKS